MTTNLRMIRVKAKIDEWFQDKIDLSDANNEEEKSNFFYTRALAALSIIIRSGVDFDTAAQSITDGYHDMGIDAVYIDSNQKKMVLVQSKWHKDGLGGVAQTEINTFLEGIKRLINLDFDGCNDKLMTKRQDIIATIRDTGYQIDTVFIHTGNQAINDYVFRPMKELLNNVNEDDEELLVFSEMKLQDVYDYITNGQNNSINLGEVYLNNWGTVETPYRAYYGTIPASIVGKWFAMYGNQLFAKNIRYYKGSTEVNQGIRDVLKNNPANFFYYNNGIKMLCKKITKNVAYSTTRELGVFSLEGVSLVNGAQTTGAIGSIYAEDPDSVASVKVFIQMIDIGDSDDEATQITKLSNTQNRIDGKDFASLDPIQEKIRRELSLGGIQYLYKSGAKVTDYSHQITLDETIVSQACSTDDISIVALAKRNVGALTDNIEKHPYKSLFNDSTNSFSLFNGVQVMRVVDALIKTKEVSSTGRKRLVLIHGNRFLLHLVLEQVKGMQGFETEYLLKETIEQVVGPIFAMKWDVVYDAMERLFSDAYPANIYKNVGRITQIKKALP